MRGIAFVGKKKSGKTFAARYLQKKYGFNKMALGDGVERISRILYDYPKYHRVPWSLQLDIYDALYRIDNSIWVDYLERRLQRVTKPVALDDARYVNEVRFLRELGFIIVRLNVPESDRKRRIGTTLRHADKGSVVLHEYFNVDNTAAYDADYSFYHDTRNGTRAALDELMKKLL